MVLLLYHKEKKIHLDTLKSSKRQQKPRVKTINRHFEAKSVLKFSIRNFTAQLNALEHIIQTTFVRLDNIQVSAR